MKHFKYLIYRTALRRNYRYGALSANDLGSYANPTGGLKTEVTFFTDRITLENLNQNKVSVNISQKKLYIMEGTGEIALNLVNKIHSTLVYSNETRKIGINIIGNQTFGNITTGTIGCGAITSSGAFTNGTNTLTIGAITSSSLTTSGNVGISCL